MDEKSVGLFFDRPDYLSNSYDRIVARSMIVQDFLGSVGEATILDVGCGDGSISLPLLSGANHITLVDLAPNMIRKAAARVPTELAKNVALINGSYAAIKDGAKFDIVLCIGVTAHVAEAGDLITKMAGHVAPGGVLILETTPTPFPLGRLFFPYYFLRRIFMADPVRYRKKHLTIAQVLSYTAPAGLRLERSVRYSFPLPGMSHWPQSLKLRYTLFTLNNPLMSRLGSEHVLLFRK